MSIPTEPAPPGFDEDRSRIASGLKPKTIRFLFKDSQVRVAVALVLFFLILAMLLGTGGWFLVASLKIKAGILGLMLLAGAVMSGFLGILMLVGTRNLYHKDLSQFGLALTPGVVVSHRPTIVVCLVDMGRVQPRMLY